MRTKKFLLILCVFVAFCLFVFAIVYACIRTTSYEYIMETEPALLLANLKVPDSMDRIENGEYVYKEGLFEVKFTHICSDIDPSKNWQAAMDEQKISISDKAVVYSMKQWRHYGYKGSGFEYCTSLCYYTGEFYLEAFLECDNPRNEKKIINAVSSFVEYVNSLFN